MHQWSSKRRNQRECQQSLPGKLASLMQPSDPLLTDLCAFVALVYGSVPHC